MLVALNTYYYYYYDRSSSEWQRRQRIEEKPKVNIEFGIWYATSAFQTTTNNVVSHTHTPAHTPKRGDGENLIMLKNLIIFIFL